MMEKRRVKVAEIAHSTGISAGSGNYNAPQVGHVESFISLGTTNADAANEAYQGGCMPRVARLVYN